MLSLGIPPNALMAVMIGAMMIHGIQPGPNIIAKQPELFWGLIASMWIGNAMLVILNLPLIGIWVRLLQVPYGYLFPTILVFCCIGTYALNSSTGEVLIMTAFGVIGYVFRKLDCEPAPLLLGLVLGPLLEENFRRALQAHRRRLVGVCHPPAQPRASARCIGVAGRRHAAGHSPRARAGFPGMSSACSL